MASIVGMSNDSSAPLVSSGFTKQEVRRFKSEGGRIASSGTPRALENTIEHPDKFEKISRSEINKLVDLFQKRSEDISSRRLSPGVTQTRLLGR